MNNLHINSEFSDLTLRIEKIFYLAAAHIDESLPSDLDDVMSDEPFDDVSSLFGLPAGLFSDDYSAEDVSQALIDFRKFGFLIQAATPVREHFTEDSWSSSWGYFYTKWLYAETLDEALELAKVWAKSQHEKNLAHFKAGGGAK